MLGIWYQVMKGWLPSIKGLVYSGWSFMGTESFHHFDSKSVLLQW